MSSFVNLMASDVWSSADIDNKVHALIRSRYSADDELKAARLARSGGDDVFVAAVDAWIAECVEQGRQARADMVLLNEVLAVEQSYLRLRRDPVEAEVDEEGNVTNQEAIDLDTAERAEATAVVQAASPEAYALVELRNPAPEPAPEPEPEPVPAAE
jgi:hypothetical protein